MSLPELILIAFSLAMDAFAVSVCKGLAMRKLYVKNALIIAFYFGVFQALMPVIGYLLGFLFHDTIEIIDHWVAFILLSFIGIRMMMEARKEGEQVNDAVDFRTMIILAIATSIDALAVGITFAFLQVSIAPAAILIGVITFGMALVGVKIGNVFGNRYRTWAALIGGVILILIGLKILLEHMGVIHF